MEATISPIETRTRINLNDTVEVVLTKYGEQAWIAHHKVLGIPVPEWQIGAPREMSFWELANIFGAKMFPFGQRPVSPVVTVIQREWP